MPLLAIAGQRTGIDRIGLAQGAKRADEGLDLAGIGAVRLPAGIGQGAEQSGFMAAGRFADHQTVRIKCRSERGKRFRVIGNAHNTAAVEGNDAVLAHIAADAAGRSGGQIAHQGLSSSGLRLSAGVKERPWQLSKRQGKRTAGHYDGGRYSPIA